MSNNTLVLNTPEITVEVTVAGKKTTIDGLRGVYNAVVGRYAVAFCESAGVRDLMQQMNIPLEITYLEGIITSIREMNVLDTNFMNSIDETFYEFIEDHPEARSSIISPGANRSHNRSSRGFGEDRNGGMGGRRRGGGR